MGEVLEVKAKFFWAALALCLAGCSNGASDFDGLPQLALASLTGGAKSPVPIANTDDPLIKAGILRFREGLQADGQPVILASNASLKYGTLLAPFGGSNGVKTWSSTSYQTISLRDGVMVATRGFGPDLMSSVLPPISQIRAAKGSTQRQYRYLDGADQPKTLDFACSLAASGSETIEVMAKTFATRKVTETCSGAEGQFTNEYWFDNSLILRQSKQFLAPGLDDMFIQVVID
jgi:hypothetical protein